MDLLQKPFRTFQNQVFAELDIDFQDSATAQLLLGYNVIQCFQGTCKQRRSAGDRPG